MARFVRGQFAEYLIGSESRAERIETDPRDGPVALALVAVSLRTRTLTNDFAPGIRPRLPNRSGAGP